MAKKKVKKPEVVYNKNVFCNGCGTAFVSKIANAEASTCPNCSKLNLLREEKVK